MNDLEQRIADGFSQLNSEISDMFIIVSKNKHVTIPPSTSSHNYAQLSFNDIAPEGYRLIGAIGFFVSSGYPHLYGSYPDTDDPNKWSFSIYNSTTLTGDAGVTGYFLCAKHTPI